MATIDMESDNNTSSEPVNRVGAVVVKGMHPNSISSEVLVISTV